MIETPLAALESWVQAQDYRGWDPFDALNSPLLRRLTGQNRRLGQVFVQVFKKSPLNLRPLLGVQKGFNPKGMGLFLASAARRCRQSATPPLLGQVERFADWLDQNKTVTQSGVGWGYNFDWPNRGFFAPAGTPTVVNSAFIGLAFLDLADLARSGRLPPGSAWGGERALDLAEATCNFILKNLNILRPAQDELCFSYTPLDKRYVHNANILAAHLLAEVAARRPGGGLAEAALAAARFTTRRQRADGAWRYGIDAMDNWVDNFHTGYVLTGLLGISRALETTELEDSISRGYQFWKKNFLPLGPGPKYYENTRYPLDIHNISQTILTGICFSARDGQAGEYISQALEFGLKHFRAPAGYFYYQKTPAFTIKIPYMRWSQAWMVRALSEMEIANANLG